MKEFTQMPYIEEVQELGFFNTSDCDFLDCQKALEDGKLRELIEKVSGSISLKDQYEDCKKKMSEGAKEFEDYKNSPTYKNDLSEFERRDEDLRLSLNDVNAQQITFQLFQLYHCEKKELKLKNRLSSAQNELNNFKFQQLSAEREAEDMKVAADELESELAKIEEEIAEVEDQIKSKTTQQNSNETSLKEDLEDAEISLKNAQMLRLSEERNMKKLEDKIKELGEKKADLQGSQQTLQNADQELLTKEIEKTRKLETSIREIKLRKAESRLELDKLMEQVRLTHENFKLCDGQLDNFKKELSLIEPNISSIRNRMHQRENDQILEIDQQIQLLNNNLEYELNKSSRFEVEVLEQRIQNNKNALEILEAARLEEIKNAE